MAKSYAVRRIIVKALPVRYGEMCGGMSRCSLWLDDRRDETLCYLIVVGGI
ncbi:hypothetical protein ACFLTK_05995 [Chloroflexota bacterium]